MTNRWNIIEIAFYGIEGRRISIKLRENDVSILTGSSGTGKSAVIAAIDYCLCSKSCKLPHHVRRRAIGVAVHWRSPQYDMIVGRVVPDSGVGTGKMFFQIGNRLSLANTFEELQGPVAISEAKRFIERSFGIADVEDADTDEKYTVGRATIRHVTPYLFLMSDVIISSETTLHDLNNPDKAKDIRATMPYFLGAVNQDTALAQRRLRKLENDLRRLERQAKGQAKARSLVTDRAQALIAQATNLGMSRSDATEMAEEEMLGVLREISQLSIDAIAQEAGDELSVLESQRRETIQAAQSRRDSRNALKALVRDAQGFDQAAVAQNAKLGLAEHLDLAADKCPICNQDSNVGGDIAREIEASLKQISSEIASVQQATPELIKQLEKSEEELKVLNQRHREIERQIREVIQQNSELRKAQDLSQAKAITIGRIKQFLETTTEDFRTVPIDFDRLEAEIEELRERVDPQALEARLSNATNLVSNYATDMVAKLPTTEPLTTARIQFSGRGNIKVMEVETDRPLDMASVGSDQNYQSIHLSLYFALHKHFTYAKSPIPGLIVIDQISRPYFPGEDDDERSVEERGTDEERKALNMIADFIFSETANEEGLQVLLIEHAFIESDKRFVEATVGRWTQENGIKLIPDEWPQRNT